MIKPKGYQKSLNSSKVGVNCSEADWKLFLLWQKKKKIKVVKNWFLFVFCPNFSIWQNMKKIVLCTLVISLLLPPPPHPPSRWSQPETFPRSKSKSSTLSPAICPFCSEHVRGGKCQPHKQIQRSNTRLCGERKAQRIHSSQRTWLAAKHKHITKQILGIIMRLAQAELVQYYSERGMITNERDECCC